MVIAPGPDPHLLGRPVVIRVSDGYSDFPRDCERMIEHGIVSQVEQPP